ncbi:hypothetical protein [Pedobacter sp. KBW06]|uniref:hypothetical protein n=1 Tax=Pedobacter sp. KBW06 TaxID=2153359 RepID=UPI000F5B23C2|nr:hypothetical protein [Pedobacter sp. KBW06]
MANSWYTYIGTGNPISPSSYSRITVKPLCLNGSTICAIYLLGETGATPGSISANVSGYITRALIQRVNQPLGAKKFVYLRCGC